MRRAAPLLLAMALAACGDPSGPIAPEPGPDDPVGTVVPSAEPPASSGPTEVPVDPSLIEPRPHAWEEVEVLDERTIRFTWYGGAPECYGLARVDVRYRPGQIVVTFYEGRVRVVEACPEYALLKAATVELDERIEGRRVTDGALRSAP